MAEEQLTAPNEMLEMELVAVINNHSRDGGLHPQVAAETVTVMAIDMLNCLSWQPKHVQAAVSSLCEAVKHMRAG